MLGLKSQAAIAEDSPAPSGALSGQQKSGAAAVPGSPSQGEELFSDKDRDVPQSPEAQSAGRAVAGNQQ